MENYISLKNVLDDFIHCFKIRYEHGVPLQKKTHQVSSTPLHGKPFQMQMMEPVSDISSAESGKHAELYVDDLNPISM